MAEEQRNKREWVHEKDFIDEETQFIVRLNKLKGSERRPRFSMEIGKINPNNRESILRHVYVSTQLETQGKISELSNSVSVIMDLMLQAKDHVVQQCQAAEDARIDYMQRKERRHQLPEQRKRPGLKKLGKSAIERAPVHLDEEPGE